MSGLSKLVRDRDNRNNTPRQLDATARPAQTRRICIACRKPPNYSVYRAKWLTANPTPASRPHDVPRSSTGRAWSEDLWCEWRMPPFELTKVCPECGGRLETITW